MGKRPVPNVAGSLAESATFSVSEARSAASCPRILYFDAVDARRRGLKTRPVTRIWKTGAANDVACGTLFHQAAERFNHLAGKTPAIRAALEKLVPQKAGSPAPKVDPAKTELLHSLLQLFNLHCLDLEKVGAKSPPQQLALTAVVRRYLEELATVLAHAISVGRPVAELLEEFFGDARRRVDVTFAVGAHDEPVRVRGVLDYLFYDWRQNGRRILDYKLTPADSPANDLSQVALYALMHDRQYGTRPAAAVLYLHPERRMVEQSWDEVQGRRHVVFDLLASMAQWIDYDEKTRTGLKPPGNPALCQQCRWNRDDQCSRRLGPKTEGSRLDHWTWAADTGSLLAEPQIEVHPITAALDYAEPPDATESAPDDQAVSTAEDRPEPPGKTDGSSEDETAKSVDNLWLGWLAKTHTDIVLPVDAMPTHVAVVGAAGSGKTWLAKVIVEEAIRAGVAVLAFDPQGDIAQFLRPSGLPADASPAERAGQAEFGAKVEPRIWTPGTSHGIRCRLNPLRLARADELSGESDAGRRAEEAEALLSAAAGSLIGFCGIGTEPLLHQTFLLEVLRALTRSADAGSIDLGRVAAATMDPVAFGVPAPDALLGSAQRQRLGRRLNALLRGPSAHLFQGGISLDLDRFNRPVENGRVPLNVIYLNALIDDNQKQFLVAIIAAEIYRWMVSTGHSGSRPRLLVYLDEARDYLPAGMSSPPAKEPLLRLFAQGRKYGVACLLCTQSPRSVDYRIFSNASTKIIGRLESAQDVERTADWFKDEGGAPAWLAGRKGAERGTFVGRWPGQAAETEGQPFQTRLLYSLHEGAWAPHRVEKEMTKNSLRTTLTEGVEAR